MKSLIRKYCSRSLGNAKGLKMQDLAPPDNVRGMKSLERSKFSITATVPTLQLNTNNIKPIVKYLKNYFLKLENFKPIQQNEEDDSKIVYMHPKCIRNWTDFDPNTVKELKQLGLNETHFRNQDITITYDNWKCDEIFKAILPVEIEAPSGYSLIGHIVHLNLREAHLEFKKVIGDVLLDKLKNCETVVNKTNEINNEYRNFQMEVLSGKEDFQTSVKENGCRFDLDFSKVYWNTRLCSEHERIVNLIQKGDILFDVFAGIGPFSVPAAKKKCTVYANDLNPESYKWLEHNAKVNKVQDRYFKAFNLDGREFIHKHFIEFLTNMKDKTASFNENNQIHVTMNLPALAVTFLDAFVGIIKGVDIDEGFLHGRKIIIHVYCFVGGDFSKDVAKDEAKKTVELNLGFCLDDQHEVHFVRSVAPNKDMFRVSFRLTDDILLGNVNSKKRKRCDSLEDEPVHKH